MDLSAPVYYSPESGLYHNRFPAMGTRLDVLLCGVEKNEGDRVFAEVHRLVCGLDGMLSHFDENSPVSTINRLACRKSVFAGEEVFRILSLCVEYHERTSGLFDAGIGKAIRLLREGKGDAGKIAGLLAFSGMEQVELDPGRNSVSFRTEEVELDLGGIGKGYALDRVKSVLESMGISDAFISFGDSSILALGDHPYGQGWRSGISHLFRAGESLYEFNLRNESMSTSATISGNARRGFKAHIVHPVKGLLEPSFLHVSVVSALAADAEVLSTALLAATEQEKPGLLRKFPGCRAVGVRYDDRENPLITELNQKQA